MITNHSYVAGIIHRVMRSELARAFDKIVVLDLHGNANRGERSPDGTSDQNVFDILQGVAIIVAVKRGNAPECTVRHGELWGSRSAKYDALFTQRIEEDAFDVVPLRQPLALFAPVNGDNRAAYDSGFALSELMPLHSGGVQTKRDALFVGYDRQEVAERLRALLAGNPSPAFVAQYQITDSSSYKLTQKIAASRFDNAFVVPFNYRPLDHRFVYYDKDLIGRPFFQTGQHMTQPRNIAMVLPRQSRRFNGALVTAGVSGQKAFDDYDINLIFPLFVYPHDGELDQTVRLNFDPKLYAAICAAAGINPADQAGPDDDFRAATGDARPSEVKVFDYIYGVLHAPNYRATFAEFLKIDFPRIPYPASPKVFRAVSERGEQLRRLHLMEHAAIGDAPYAFQGEGDDIVAAGYPKFENGRVYINPDQYFDAAPPVTWTFHIGGYQPAQKWLKDRRGRSLSYDDIGHYQRILKILSETDRIMAGIHLPLTEQDGPAEDPPAK